MSAPHVVVVGGGNAGLCAAMSAQERGARVTLIERAAEWRRGGNSRHTRNFRGAHAGPDAYVTESYSTDELGADVAKIRIPDADPELVRFLVEESVGLPAWMEAHGARWQQSLRGTLHLSRTNRFFLGGGKALINAYYRTAEAAGITIRYESEVVGIDLDGSRCRGVAVERDGSREDLAADAVVMAAGGFEADLDWMARYWGAAAQNFMVRGTPLNDGRILRLMLDAGAQPIGDPTRFHAVAVDARGPKFDGGIVTRLDVVPVSIVVDQAGRRFHDEGEDLWPKRYADWGRLIAQQDGQIAYAILDSKRRNDIMPPVFPPFESETVAGLADQLGLDGPTLEAAVAEFNAHVPAGQASDLERLDGCSTVGLVPPKSNWALTIDAPPYVAFPLRPGITFTYHGVAVDVTGRVRTATGTFDNVFAAGEIMAGNILNGYIAGIGMTVGTVFGRLAGRGAAADA